MSGGKMHGRSIAVLAMLALIGCSRPTVPAPPVARQAAAPVLAVEGVLADFAHQVGGDRAVVQSLVPPGVDPREYEPTPGDIAAAARARLVIANGVGLERFMEALLSRAGPDAPVIEASRGLETLPAADGEPEPHLWLDPQRAVRYVQNIRDALSRADPSGELVFGANGDAYIRQLRELDAWISDQVGAVPPDKRVLTSAGEDLAYFAERYGITILPAMGGSTAPQVLNGLTGPSGPAPSYLDMMRYDVKLVTSAMGAAD
jgi:ABC-type Zn uptake system ZnuABC Zn-binding protein ZnuA